MKAPIEQVQYRCVDIFKKQWFRIHIDFSQEHRYILKIHTNRFECDMRDFKPFLVTYRIYKSSPHGFRAMHLKSVEDTGKYYLVQTSAFLSVSEFKDAYEQANPQISANIRHQHGLKLKDEASVTTLSPKRHVLDCKLENFEYFFHAIAPPPIMTVLLMQKKNGENLSGSEQELSRYNLSATPNKDFLCSSILESSPSRVETKTGRSKHVTFSPHIREVPRCKLRRDSTSRSQPAYHLLIKACMTPMGRWGSGVLLLGLLFFLLANSGTVISYIASTMAVTGVLAVGISMFRVHRKESIRVEKTYGSPPPFHNA